MNRYKLDIVLFIFLFISLLLSINSVFLSFKGALGQVLIINLIYRMGEDLEI